MTGVTSKFCEERSVSQKFTRELVSFNFPVTTKNVQQSINLCFPDSMTMLGQRWHRVVRLAYGWGWKYNVGPKPLR